jgi:hypothetical protein
MSNNRARAGPPRLVVNVLVNTVKSCKYENYEMLLIILWMKNLPAVDAGAMDLKNSHCSLGISNS